jgi:hypothetical protein
MKKGIISNGYMHHKRTHALLSITLITNDFNYQLFNQLAKYGNKESAIVLNQIWELISQGIQSLNLCGEVSDHNMFCGLSCKRSQSTLYFTSWG